MAIPKVVHALEGSWKGSSKLNLSEDPLEEKIFESDSTLLVETDPRSAFATIAYTWSHEGEAQYGALLLCGSDSEDVVTAGWVDSWHQNGALMAMKGLGMDSHRIAVTGAYTMEVYSDWSWRIEIGSAGDELEFAMINIAPDKTEAWAVYATYQRV